MLTEQHLSSLPTEEYQNLIEWIATAFCTALYSVEEQRSKLGDLNFTEFTSETTLKTIADAHEHAKDLQMAVSEKEQFITNFEISDNYQNSSPSPKSLLQVFLATKSISDYWLNVATQTRIDFEERIEFLEQLQIKISEQKNEESVAELDKDSSKIDDALNLSTFAALALDFYQDRDTVSVSTLFSQSGLGQLEPEIFLNSETIQKHINSKTCASIQHTVDQWCSKIENMLKLDFLFDNSKDLEKSEFYETLHEVDSVIPSLHVELEHRVSEVGGGGIVGGVDVDTPRPIFSTKTTIF